MDDYFKRKYTSLSTKNMFLESCFELGIGLTEDLTEKAITNAYHKVLIQHKSAIQKGIKPPFEMQIKIQAMEYLLSRINSK